MPPVLARMWARIQSTLSGISLGQRIVVVLLTLALILGGVFFVRWASQPTYAPLFSSLASPDASAIVEELNAQGVKYELADGGGTVMVPKDQVYAMRLAMSGKGLPAGKSTGYALLDKEGVTASEFQQQVKYQRAVEGELQSTLEAMDGVSSAVVHIALPKDNVFADDTAKPTASVLVGLKPGTKLNGSQVQAMTHLVASSIEGMSPADVTLADTTGQVLNAPGAEGMLGAAGDAQTQMQTDVQNRLAKQAQDMLDRVVGPGKATVRVAADLDFNAKGSTSETYTYTKGVPPLSESTTTEKYTNGAGGLQVGGVLGPQNPEGTNTTTGGATGGNYDKGSNTRNNAVNKTVETVKVSTGQVKRMTVSVLLDDKVGANLDQAQVQALVENAVGFDIKRGDALTVATMPFDTSAEALAKAELAAAEKAAQRAQMIEYAKQGGIALLILIALFVAWLRSRKRKPKAPKMLTVEQSAELGRIRQEISSQARAGDILDDEAKRRAQVRKEITVLIDEQPEEVTAMLRGWLAEERA